MMSIGSRIYGLCNEMNFLLLKYRSFFGCLFLMYASVVFFFDDRSCCCTGCFSGAVLDGECNGVTPCGGVGVGCVFKWCLRTVSEIPMILVGRGATIWECIVHTNALERDGI
jgi:hypothetical protein